MKVKKINMIKNYYYNIKKVIKKYFKKKLKIGLEPFLFLFDKSVVTMGERRFEPSLSEIPESAN